METTSMESRQLHSSQKEALKKILEFSGESNELDIDEWLFDLTNLYSLMKLNDETKILETMGKLTGPALKWYQENLRSFKNWDEVLQFVTFNYNTSMHATTKQTPFELMHGRQATLPFDQQNEIISLTQDLEHGQKIRIYLEKLVNEARKNILENQQQYKHRYDLHRQDLLLKINDLVLIKTRNIRNKFDIRYEGPFKIIEQLGSKTFIVQHVKKSTLTRQVTMDIIVPLVERWNLI